MSVNLKFGTLFSIKISHPYFRGGTPRDLTLVPSEETETFLKSSGFIFRNKADQYYLHIPSDRSQTLEGMADKSLFFYLINRNPFFVNFTELPSTFDQFRKRQVLYFHNHEREEIDGKIFLHEDELLGEEIQVKNNGGNGRTQHHYDFDKNIIVYGSDYCTLKLTEEEVEQSEEIVEDTIKVQATPVEDIKIEVKDALNEKTVFIQEIIRDSSDPKFDKISHSVNDEVVLEEMVPKGQMNFLINLSNEPEKTYRIFINDEEKKEFYLLRAWNKSPPLGIVQICLEDIISDIEGDDETILAYHINFRNRATIWKYCFIKESPRVSLDEIKVMEKVGNGMGQSFNERFEILEGKELDHFKKNVPIEDLEKVFVSVESIGLEEVPSRKFHYFKNATATEGFPLPAATPNRLKIDKEENVDPFYCSEIFIYL